MVFYTPPYRLWAFVRAVPRSDVFSALGACPIYDCT